MGFSESLKKHNTKPKIHFKVFITKTLKTYNNEFLSLITLPRYLCFIHEVELESWQITDPSTRHYGFLSVVRAAAFATALPF